MNEPIDIQTALKLTELTTNFYNQVAKAFSDTRTSAWKGWDQVCAAAGVGGADVCASAADEACVDVPTATRPLKVLDLACGNMRFAKFLAEKTPAYVLGIDNCPKLADFFEPEGDAQVDFIQLDIINALYAKEKTQSGEGSSGTGAATLDARVWQQEGLAGTHSALLCAAHPSLKSAFDLAVSFGFMHHLPRGAWRAQVLEALIDACVPGGFVAVSFWQFVNSEKLLAKAAQTTERARLETGIELGGTKTGDFLLGWQDVSSVYRYCHSFTEDEIDALLAPFATKIREVARFSADGKSNNLNRYVVLQKL